MSILILALIMAGTMIGAASYAVVMEMRKELIRTNKSVQRGHFEDNYRD